MSENTDKPKVKTPARSPKQPTYAEGRKKHPTYESGDRKPHLTLLTGRKPGSGTNPNSWTLPQKMTPELMEEIVWGVYSGLSLSKAFSSVGFAGNSSEHWRKKAEDGKDEQAVMFMRYVEMAEAKWEKRLLEKIEEHGEKVFTANCWLLERLKQDVYALQTKLSGKVELEAVTAKDALIDQAKAKAIANDPNLMALASKTIIDVTPKEVTMSQDEVSRPE